jgi:hypothetical protein
MLTKMGSQYSKVEASEREAKSTLYHSWEGLEHDLLSLEFFKIFPEKAPQIALVKAELESKGSCSLEAVVCS